MENILHTIYPATEIYIADHSFNNDDLAITVDCLVPSTAFYTAKPIPYVTAENYVRCLSQASYLLAEYILQNNLLSLDISVESFREAAANYELYYRNLAMTFHARVKRGEVFRMFLSLKNWREIKKIHDYLLFTFVNQRAVISGEMSFVFVAK